MVQPIAKRGSRSANGYGSVRYDATLHVVVQELAYSRNVPIVTVIEEAVREYLERHNQRKLRNTTV
jgi:predicted transcriptional regulator